MNVRENKIKESLGRWQLYAMSELGMTSSEADLEWKNYHLKGKYVVCGATEDNTTRLFIRLKTDPFTDISRREGWWNTFTVSKKSVSKGLYICKIDRYRHDRNGYLNLIVEPITDIDDLPIRTFFGSESGTWESPAMWLIMCASKAFLPDYEFDSVSFKLLYHQNPNINALKEKFPEVKDMNTEEIGKYFLNKYLNKDFDLKLIEDTLNTLTNFEELVRDIEKAIIARQAERVYGNKYPLFAKKVTANVVEHDIYIRYRAVEDYLERQMDYYDQLCHEGKIQPLEENADGVLERVEQALAYRQMLKDQEKAAKKAKRQANK